MKKRNILLSFSIVLILFSCSSDDDSGSSNTAQNLVSVTKDYYTNNSQTASTKFNFYNDKLINIQYSDNSYDDIYYEAGLISRILEFNANNEWIWTTVYTYDSSNRLTRKNVIPSPNNPITDVSRQKQILYNGNLIQSENSWSDGGFHKNTITLNSEDFIIEDNQFSINNELVAQRNFEYVDNNLSRQTIKDRNGNLTYEETYNYTDKSGSEPYNYSKYLFGSQWKNNSSLNKQFGLGQITPYEVSGNYISDYYTRSLSTNTSKTGTFNYKFNSNKNIIKQTENINLSTGEVYKIITTYEYQ